MTRNVSGMYRAEVRSVTDGGERSEIIHAEKGLIEWTVRRSEGTLGEAQARALAWELQAFEKMDFDLLVVSPTTRITWRRSGIDPAMTAES